jgi:hypothetical protein
MAIYKPLQGLSVGVLPGVAGLAEGLEVRVPMGAASGDGDDVVNVLGGNQAASSLAEFAKRVLGDVGIANFYPMLVI